MIFDVWRRLGRRADAKLDRDETVPFIERARRVIFLVGVQL